MQNNFTFATNVDASVARRARHPRIIEDIVTSLGSVAGVRHLLSPHQDVHAVAILRRGEVRPFYRENLMDHYLLERELPLDADEFERQCGVKPVPETAAT